MPTAPQRAILGAAKGLTAFYQGRIAALNARQQAVQAANERFQKERRLDIDQTYATAQLLNATNQQRQIEGKEQDPETELKRELVTKTINQIRTVGWNGLNEDERRVAFAVLGRDYDSETLKIKSLDDAITARVQNKLTDDQFMEWVETSYEAGLPSLRESLYLKGMVEAPWTEDSPIEVDDGYGGTKIVMQSVPRDPAIVLQGVRDAVDQAINSGTFQPDYGRLQEIGGGTPSDQYPGERELDARIRELEANTEGLRGLFRKPTKEGNNAVTGSEKKIPSETAAPL